MTTATTTGLAPANPILPIRGAADIPHGLDITVTPSPEGTGVSDASLKKRSSQHVYHFTKKVSWKGETYLLSIDFPCKNWAKLDSDELKHAADEYAEVFLADLQMQLDNQSCPEDEKIKPGDDIAISFRGERGYNVYVQSGFDTQDPNALHKKNLEATGDTSRKLSEIINTNVENTTDYPKTLHQKLQADSLKTLREKTIANRSVPTLPPANLKHKDSNCFLNSAFQSLVHDPVLRDELRNPDNYKKGKEDPLYKAIQGYDNHKDPKEPFELPDLGISTDTPKDAVLDALTTLTKDRFEDDSLLATTSFLPDPAKFDASTPLSLEKIAQDQNKEKLPQALNLYVARTGADRKKITTEVSLSDKGTISLSNGSQSKDYELTSFMVHHGDDLEKGHYITYVRQGDQYWKLDDMKQVQSISSESFHKAAKKGSYFRFCEQKATKQMSASTKTPEKGANVVLDQFKDGIQTTISIEQGSMKNVPSEFLIVHPSNKNLTKTHPQIQELNIPLSQEIKTEKNWRNLWGFLNTTYEPATNGILGHWRADLVKGEKTNILHVPMHDRDLWVENAAEARVSPEGTQSLIQDTLEFAVAHGCTKIAFPIPLIPEHVTEKTPNLAVAYEYTMRDAIDAAVKKMMIRTPLEIKIIYPESLGQKRQAVDQSFKEDPTKIREYQIS